LQVEAGKAPMKVNSDKKIPDLEHLLARHAEHAVGAAERLDSVLF
jgi:hypothetical protein